MHLCPVCGYDRLTEPPRDFTICPSCGTEFGYDDAFASHSQLRTRWLQNGARWWSPVDQCPDNWDPTLQVEAVVSAIWAYLAQQQTTTNAPAKVLSGPQYNPPISSVLGLSSNNYGEQRGAIVPGNSVGGSIRQICTAQAV